MTGVDHVAGREEHRLLLPSHAGITAGRYLPEKNRLMAEGIYELSGKTLGIVGFGRIGREVAKRAVAFDMTVIYYDIVRPDPEEESGPVAVPDPEGR